LQSKTKPAEISANFQFIYAAALQPILDSFESMTQTAEPESLRKALKNFIESTRLVIEEIGKAIENGSNPH